MNLIEKDTNFQNKNAAIENQRPSLEVVVRKPARLTTTSEPEILQNLWAFSSLNNLKHQIHATSSYQS
jgi:hypothetical protein